MIILRIPDIMVTFYHIKFNTQYTELSFYYDTGKIIELFDFLFPINPLFQFILFYKYNKNFRESFEERFSKNTMTNKNLQ